MWSVYIQTKSSSRNVKVNDLKLIKQRVGGQLSEIKDFKEFMLKSKQNITFIGSASVISVISDDIEFVHFEEAKS